MAAKWKAVNIMFGIELSSYDRQVYEEKLADFLPERMIDVHTHIWKEEFGDSFRSPGLVTWPTLVAPECTVEDLRHSYTQMFPGKTVLPVLMGQPTANKEKTNSYTIACARREKLPAMFCTSYNMPAETIRKALTEDGFAGLKPYLNNAPAHIPPDKREIFDFLPREHLAVADECGAAIILHIARPGRLKDPVNVAQLMEIEQDYPNIKLIVAHIGRAYIESDIGNAFETLGKSKRMVFDFSANTLDKAMIACLEAVGPKRLQSDMPITKMRMYRIEEDGIYKNVVPRGLYGDVSYDKNMKETDEENVTIFMYEELMAFRRAAQTVGLTRQDVEDVFYNNAARIFRME